MYEYASLDIPGFSGGKLPNTFVRQGAATLRLGVLLPGIAYTTDMPLLYYARALLLGIGADTLSVEAGYHRQPAFRAASPPEQYRWLTTDAAAGCAAALGQHAYDRVTLVGKSLGTLAIGYLVANNPRLAQADCIWLTPLLHDRTLREQIQAVRPRSLFISGGADSLYDAEAQQEVAGAVDGQSLVIAGADHSLEIAGDLARSLQALQQVVSAIQGFLNGP